ncbi:TetR/AcrR family transcriptional regulator [Streptomyces koyangensis]|uniref:TetR/AcrR family transcriptional regulator n=2 Tax=Streptomyces koyangensis TaxID=188770 RepID=A0A385DL92_9ACTN|nr:TetR/AcrR family transcriptional regulator [Streptomyces koyangensis]
MRTTLLIRGPPPAPYRPPASGSAVPRQVVEGVQRLVDGMGPRTAVADRILLSAMDGYRPEGDWKQRVTAVALRVREAFGRHPQLAAVWGRYASGGTGSRLVMEELLQALSTSGLPDEEIPARYHRLAVLVAALVASEAAIGTAPPPEREQGLELFRVAVFGADPAHFPALTRFGRDILPLGAERAPAFEEILAAQLADVEATIAR